MNVSAKSQKYGTKEIPRKGAEPDARSVQPPANDVKAAATAKNLPQSARDGTTAGHGRNDARKNGKEPVKYVTRRTGTAFSGQ